MTKRLIRALFVCIVLCTVVAAAHAQAVVKLERKFTEGEVLRYKIVMDATVAVNMTMPNGGKAPAMPMRMVMVVKQQTKKILDSGDAEIETTPESMKLDILGNSQDMPVGQNVVTMVMSRNGVVKSIKGADSISMFGGMPMMNAQSMAAMSVLPTGDLKVGDTWTREASIVVGGKIKVQGKLASTDTPLGSSKVAVFTEEITNAPATEEPAAKPETAKTEPTGESAQAASGTTEPPAQPAAPSVQPLPVNVKEMKLTSKNFFSVEKGQLIRTDISGNVKLSMAPMAMGGSSQAPLDMDMQMTVQMYQLQPAKTK